VLMDVVCGFVGGGDCEKMERKREKAKGGIFALNRAGG